MMFHHSYCHEVGLNCNSDPCPVDFFLIFSPAVLLLFLVLFSTLRSTVNYREFQD